jgi:hypothetical protein
MHYTSKSDCNSFIADHAAGLGKAGKRLGATDMLGETYTPSIYRVN